VQNNLEIRDALPDELDEVSRLLRAAYSQYKKSMPPAIWRNYLADITDVRSRLPFSELIVAGLEKHLVGTVTLYTKNSYASEVGWPQDWAGIRLLAVDPASRNRGIGRALINECIRRCRERGIAIAGLHTTEMMEAAVRLYENMGFERVPKFDFHPAPGVVVMAYRYDISFSDTNSS
jgi:ribosomal protein S18 acetylase RimI-like enzyme